MKRILIIGLGEIGYANAKYMSNFKSRLAVHGYDINDRAVRRAIDDSVIERAAEGFKGYNIYIVCVSTHDAKDMNKPNLDALYDVMRRIGNEASSGALVSIESTVPLGTCRPHAVKLARKHDICLVHTPHRYWKNPQNTHGVNQLRVMGAYEACCEAKADELYLDILGIPLHRTKSLEVAEASKIVENMHRGVNIALAEEIKMWAERNDLSFDDLREACNTKWNINIMEARDGCGGHCIRKDSELYLENSKMPVSIARAAANVDDLYRQYVKLKRLISTPSSN